MNALKLLVSSDAGLASLGVILFHDRNGRIYLVPRQKIDESDAWERGVGLAAVNALQPTWRCTD